MNDLRSQRIDVLRVKVFPGGEQGSEAAFVCFLHALVDGRYVVRSAAGPTADSAYTSAYAKLTQPLPEQSSHGDDDLPF
mgnify:CR=1 FL=1